MKLLRIFCGVVVVLLLIMGVFLLGGTIQNRTGIMILGGIGVVLILILILACALRIIDLRSDIRFFTAGRTQRLQKEK